MIRTFILRDAAIVDRCCAYLKTLVGGEQVFAVTVTEAERKRTLEQNDLLHKLLRTIADEGWLNGRQGSVDDWKAYLLISLGYADTYTDLKTGELRAIPRATSTMSVRQMSELIEAIHKYAAQELGLEL